MKTEQVNIRMPKGWVFDLEFIGRANKMSKSDWLKYQLNTLIRAEKDRLIELLEKDYVYCRKTDEEFKEILGYPASCQLRNLRSEYSAKIRNLVKSQKNTKFAKKAILEYFKPHKGKTKISELMKDRSPTDTIQLK